MYAAVCSTCHGEDLTGHDVNPALAGDTFLARWSKHPDFAVYHFGVYEPAALKRLMGRHATRAEELDRLLRLFIDRFGSPPVSNAVHGRRPAAAADHDDGG